MAFYGKEYRCSSQENFDAFLKFVGAPEDKIPSLVAFTPTLKLVQNSDSYTYYTQNPGNVPVEINFKSGVEFDDVIGPMKYPIKNKYEVEGNTVKQTVTSDKSQAYFLREYDGDQMTLTITARGWDGVAKRTYKL